MSTTNTTKDGRDLDLIRHEAAVKAWVTRRKVTAEDVKVAKKAAIPHDYFVLTQLKVSKYKKNIPGKQYHYDRTVSGYKKLAKGSKFIIYSDIDDSMRFVGYGTVGEIVPDKDDFLAKFSEYGKLGSPQTRTPDILEAMESMPSYVGRKLSIWPITQQLYQKIVGEDLNDALNVGSDVEIFEETLSRKKHLILYGPPGTGKTFTANNFAEQFVSKNKSIEDTSLMSDEQYKYHVINQIKKHAQHFDYDLVEENRANYSFQNEDSEMRLVVIFSKSGKKNQTNIWLKVTNKAINFLNGGTQEENCFYVIINSDTKSFVILPLEIEKKYARYSKSDTEEIENFDRKSTYDFHIHIAKNEAKLPTREHTHNEKHYDCTKFLNNLDVLGIGSPVSRVIETKNTQDFIHKVTFHPSYSYEEFVEGLKPKLHGDDVGYAIESGIFKSICTSARIDPQNRYVLLIDEINRGNISKIFGELITLIEKDKREDHSLTLAYSKEPFSVPENLYIIGTMNTADRSLTQLDVALRRRFGFYELLPDSSLLNKRISEIHLGTLLNSLNERIRAEGLREKQIGHSYFMDESRPLSTIKDLEFVFTNEIIPLLQDYFYEDYNKIQKILGTAFVDVKEMKIKTEWKKNPDIFKGALKEIVRKQ